MNEGRAGSGHYQSFLSLFIVPIIFLLHNLNFFRGLLFYRDVYWLMTAYLLLPVALYFLFRKIWRQPQETSITVTLLLLLLFFFFGAIQDFLLQYRFTQLLGKTYVLPLLFLAPAVYILLKRPPVAKWLNSLFFALLFFLLSELAVLLFNLPAYDQKPLLAAKVTFETKAGTQRNDSINIHHIIFDGYTNSTTLQKLFHYVNPVDSFLLRQGFYIAGKTKSNYNFTPYSLAATLNLQYLRLTEKQLVRDYKNYLWGAKVYQANKVFQFFQGQQYHVSHFSILDDYSHLDKLGTFVPKTPFYSLRYQTIERVLMNPWLRQKASGAPAETIPLPVKESLRYYVQYNQEAFRHALHTNANRQYNFTHFLLPHEPYVFSKQSVDSLQLHHLMDYANGYIKQVEYANKLIELIVTELRKNPHNVIVLQGDHGFRDYDGSRFSPLTQNEALNAFYFPDQNYEMLYDTISPVNTYRVILKKYFGQQLPVLHDRHFVPVE